MMANCVRVGASIVVITERQFSSVYNKLIYNPQCFILHGGISDKTPLSDINNVSVVNYVI